MTSTAQGAAVAARPALRPFATTWEEVYERLRDPFAPQDIEWRVQAADEKNGKPWARVLAYVTNRAIMDRLDETVGPGHWQNRFRAGPGGGIICGLSIRVGHARWVTKWDGAENTDIESVKGGLSNAMKRAAVQWSIGRYLYDLEEGWAVVSEAGRFSAKTKGGKWFKWDPPALPTWAMPQPHAATPAQLSRIDTLCARLEALGNGHAKTAASVRKRVTAGLTEQTADDALRFLRAAVDDAEATNTSSAA